MDRISVSRTSSSPRVARRASLALGLFAFLGLLGCRGNDFAAFHRDPPVILSPRNFDGLLGERGDPALARWPDGRRFSPPFTALGRLRAGSTLTWSYDPTGAPLPEEEVRAVIRRVLDEWRRAGAGVTFVEQEPGGDSSRGAENSAEGNRIEIGWRTGEHEGCATFLGWDGGLAHATDPNWPGVGFVHLNAALTWSPTTVTPDESGSPGPRGLALRRPRKTQLETVLLHELGHTLGLGHSCDPDAIMSEVYSAVDPTKPGTQVTGAARPPRITPSDAAGLQSLYGGGLTEASDLFICSVDDAGIPHPVAPALRRFAPPGAVTWDVIDADGDGCDELITWASNHARVAPLGQGLCLVHFGAGALIERVEGPALGMIDPGRPLLLRDGISRVETGELGYRLENGSIARLRFSSDGLPLKGVAPRPPADRGHGEVPRPVRSDSTESLEGESSGRDARAGDWWIGGSATPHPLRDLDGDGSVDLLFAGEPDAEGRRPFSFADRGETGRVRFHARAAIPADLDGDGVFELVVQGLE